MLTVENHGARVELEVCDNFSDFQPRLHTKRLDVIQPIRRLISMQRTSMQEYFRRCRRRVHRALIDEETITVK